VCVVAVCAFFYYNQPSTCDQTYKEIDQLINKSNYCLTDPDCDVLSLGGQYVKFGCYHFVNKNVNKEEIYAKMDVYNHNCSKIIDECYPNPKPVCVAGRCQSQLIKKI
jgi:hypothetical protein